MLDLDKLIREGIEIKLNGKVINVRQLTVKQAKEIDKLQSEMNEKNAYEKRTQITKIILNNNLENVRFSDVDIEKIPVKLQVAIHNELNKYVYDLSNDPN